MSRRDRSCSPVESESGPVLESLEPRKLLSVQIELDFSLDTNNFFDTQEKRDLLQQAADMLADRLEDTLDAIEPVGFNEWEARIIHPGTGDPNHSIPGLVVPEDTLIVFAGGRNLDGSLGRGGAGGFTAQGSQAWLDTVAARGEPGALPAGGNPHTDFAPWGGAITFDTETLWHFGETTEGLDSNEADFFSVAKHELIHLLGFADSTESYAALVDEVALEFKGPAAQAEWDEPGFPRLASDLSHWEEGLTDNGQETAMDPTLTTGTRKAPTPLDLAVLDDIGWELTNEPGFPGVGQLLALDIRTGDTDSVGTLDGLGDNAVFSFESLAAGTTFVDVIPDDDTILDAEIRVFDESGVLIAQNSEGSLGTTADEEFVIDGAAQVYTVEVVSTGGSGGFTIRVDSEPVTHFLYYPEGFANDQISEFVSVTNPNDFPVTYTVRLSYEDPSLEFEEAIVVQSKTIPAAARDGVTISDGENDTRAIDLLNGGQVFKNTPYAIIIESDAPLAATISHFDFSIATGETFTGKTSDNWTFPRATRPAPEDFVNGSPPIFDFPIFYNPNDHDARVSMTVFPLDGSPSVTLTQVVGSDRRGGWNINNEAALPFGEFAVIITSEAFDPADQDDHIGIVAAITHFNDAEEQGWSVLGDPNGGATEVVVPNLEFTPGGDVELLLFNPGDIAALPSLTVSYLNSTKPDLTLNVQSVGPKLTRTFNAASLGMVEGDKVAVRLTTAIGNATFGQVAVQGIDVRFADSASVNGQAFVGKEFFFGDAFINANLAGVDYFETLSFFNPDIIPIEIDVEFRFSDGVQASTSVTVQAEGFFTLDLHTLPEILTHKNLNFFGIIVDSENPFAVTMTHFDLFFGSGWGAAGAPLGLTVPLASIDTGIDG